MKLEGAKPEHWLILAYLFNLDGKAASQTITDRIPLLLANGIVPAVLSGPIGEKDDRFTHYRLFSCMPSGLQYELRYLLKRSRMARWPRELLKAMVSVLCLPLYLLERTLIHLDTHWSWCISGFAGGLLSIARCRPELIYSTAGPSSTHLAACCLHLLTGIPWIAELHDPLVYDHAQGKRSQRHLFQDWLEKMICRHAAVAIFFTDTALRKADRRHPIAGVGAVLRPGADPPLAPRATYTPQSEIHFAHFGSLAPTRNLEKVIEAFSLLLSEQPAWSRIIRVDIYGSGLDDVSAKALRRFPLDEVLQEHGRLEYDDVSGKSGRQQVVEAMQRTDVLLLLHGSGEVCEEYVPSKVYEYLLTGRPILGLTPPTTELGSILLASGHAVVDPDDVSALKDAFRTYILSWQEGGLDAAAMESPYRIEDTVQRLLALARQAAAGN